MRVRALHLFGIVVVSVFLGYLVGSNSIQPEVPPPGEQVVVPEALVTPLMSWPLIGGIIATVVVLGLLIFFLSVRHRAY